MSPRELRLEIQADLKISGEIGNKRPIKSNTNMSKIAQDIFKKLDKIRKRK